MLHTLCDMNLLFLIIAWLGLDDALSLRRLSKKCKLSTKIRSRCVRFMIPEGAQASELLACFQSTFEVHVQDEPTVKALIDVASIGCKTLCVRTRNGVELAQHFASTLTTLASSSSVGSWCVVFPHLRHVSFINHGEALNWKFVQALDVRKAPLCMTSMTRHHVEQNGRLPELTHISTHGMPWTLQEPRLNIVHFQTCNVSQQCAANIAYKMPNLKELMIAEIKTSQLETMAKATLTAIEYVVFDYIECDSTIDGFCNFLRACPSLRALRINDMESIIAALRHARHDSLTSLDIPGNATSDQGLCDILTTAFPHLTNLVIRQDDSDFYLEMAPNPFLVPDTIKTFGLHGHFLYRTTLVLPQSIQHLVLCIFDEGMENLEQWLNEDQTQYPHLLTIAISVDDRFESDEDDIDHGEVPKWSSNVSAVFVNVVRRCPRLCTLTVDFLPHRTRRLLKRLFPTVRLQGA